MKALIYYVEVDLKKTSYSYVKFYYFFRIFFVALL